jgi:glyoxylase-like metal-dependent hydrolase (beta-lactamase superfamily II)/rhodanese-related sulfurtransferase
MFLRQLFDADTWTYTYLIADGDTKQALLIDPVRDRVDRDLALVRELGFELEYALDTHVHADHVTGAGLLRERTGCKTVAGKLGPESADLRLAEGDTLRLGDVVVRVLETPGHTDDSTSFHVEGNVFTGDALLVRGNGRTDFQEGSAEQLYESICDKLFALPDATLVWPGHDYNGHTVSTIGEEKRFNPRIAGKSRAEFVAVMAALKLPAPRFLHQAVPANRELGLGTGPEQSSGRFNEIDGATAAHLATKMRILDVREPHEFRGELGHIEGAENVPMGQCEAASRGWPRDQPLLVVCRSGRRSREVCELLVAAGFDNVTNLRGGMLDFRERGRAKG